MDRKQPHSERLEDAVGKPGRGASAVGYVRYSSDLQSPATITTQKRRIQEFAESNGWHMVHWYEELETSAKFDEIEKRPVFAQLLEDAGREFTVVLCYTNDRWARNAGVAYTSLDELRRRRVWWATADGQWDIDKVEEDGPDIAFAIDTQFNAAFIRRMSRRAVDAKEDRARDGYHNGSVPFGYLPPDYPKAPDGAPSTWKPPRMPVRADPANFPALVRLGELAAQGWTDAAIADELKGYVSITPRFGERPLAKDTVGAMRRMWFPREFTPGCGHGTIEAPSGELFEGRHPSAWPYELWQKMVEAKEGKYHRVQSQTVRRTLEFSRIICCAGCGRALRVSGERNGVHYRDTSRMRQLECANFGCLSVSAERVSRQFGSLLNTIQLPGLWQDVVLQECYEVIRENGTEQLMDQRSKLEAEKKGLVMAFAKGYISEEELDIEIARVRSTLLSLPRVRGYGSGEEYGQHAIATGKSLMEAANCWISGTSTERRDLVWSMLDLNGLVYDLQRQCIVGIKPRDVALPALKLGLQEHWRLHDQGLWLREEYIDIYAATGRVELGDALRSRGRRLGADQWLEAKHLLQEGMPPQEVARHFHVSTWVIIRLIQRDEPERTAQQQPNLGAEQQLEAMEMLRQGKSLRRVAARFHVSRMAIWRMVHRAEEEGKFQGQ